MMALRGRSGALSQWGAACGLALAVATTLPALAQGSAPGGPQGVAPGNAQRAAQEAGPAWSALTAPQRNALAPLQEDWHTIDAARKQKWLQVAGRMARMAPAERERIGERMAAWARLTPAERGRARAQFLEAQQFAPEDRLARWEAYQALPEEQRQALAQRATPQPATRKDAASAAAAAAERRQVTPPAPKRNVLEASPPVAIKPVAPTVVQVKPGATTTLVSRQARPPAHQQPGQPKIAIARDAVDPATLLPLKGPSGTGAPPRPDPAPAEPEPSTEP